MSKGKELKVQMCTVTGGEGRRGGEGGMGHKDMDRPSFVKKRVKRVPSCGFFFFPFFPVSLGRAKLATAVLFGSFCVCVYAGLLRLAWPCLALPACFAYLPARRLSRTTPRIMPKENYKDNEPVCTYLCTYADNAEVWLTTCMYKHTQYAEGGLHNLD